VAVFGRYGRAGQMNFPEDVERNAAKAPERKVRTLPNCVHMTKDGRHGFSAGVSIRLVALNQGLHYDC
jgi:hypothetical protein